MIGSRYLCIHCHFYQPPRGNPFNEESLVELDAAPFRNWNERVTHQCYQPNAALGNFEHISFNLGETLASWLFDHAPETYHRIIQSDAVHLSQYGIGNAIAQPVHHTILPLSRYEDKVTQVAWGKAVFEHRFGRSTRGMWLPEMAVDLETLEVLVDQGIEWTILTERQVEGKGSGAGPFWVKLPGGRKMRIFVRDETLSNDIAFNLGNFGGAGRWAREVLVPRRRDAGSLTLIATDGETFGHHWLGEEQFLHWLVHYEALAAGYEMITLGRYAQLSPPVSEVTIKENSSWSCGHGLARWATGCSCTPGDPAWKGAIRRALDNVCFELDGIYKDFAGSIDGVDPLALRNAYIDVVLGKVAYGQFLKEQSITAKDNRAKPLMKLVEAQYYRQRMYASCVFFFPELNAHSTIYGIANAAYAIKLTREATGTDLSANFRRDLSIAVQRDAKTGQLVVGSNLFDEVMRRLEK